MEESGTGGMLTVGKRAVGLYSTNKRDKIAYPHVAYSLVMGDRL